MSLKPKLNILPPTQSLLWPELAQIPQYFVLYGGTAIALRIGHRSSVDFDFFTTERFSTEELLRSVPWLTSSRIIQSAPQTLSVTVRRGEGEVKVSFFGGLSIGRVGEPQLTEDGGVLVASLLDLAGMKAAVVTQRSESKDYLDLLALIEDGVSLPMAIAAAAALYPDTYNPIITTKALVYFGDGDLHKLSPAQRGVLQREVASLSAIPAMKRCAERLSPVVKTPAVTPPS